MFAIFWFLSAAVILWMFGGHSFLGLRLSRYFWMLCAGLIGAKQKSSGWRVSAASSCAGNVEKYWGANSIKP